GQSALLVKDRFQTLALDVFHGVEVQSILAARLVEPNNPGMLQRAEGVDLALETVQEAGILGQLGGQDLDGRLAAADLLVAEIDPTHAAVAEFLVNHPLAEALAEHGLIRCEVFIVQWSSTPAPVRIAGIPAVSQKSRASEHGSTR